jgi:hypothetical protein
MGVEGKFSLLEAHRFPRPSFEHFFVTPFSVTLISVIWHPWKIRSNFSLNY